MSPLERWSLHAAAWLTAATGLLDGGLRWFGQRMGEFGPEPSPWLGLAQHLHVLVAPLLVFTLGVMVRGHLWARLRTGANGRRTGLGLAFLIAPMVLSGYAVQVATDPAWRTALSWTHGLSAGLFLLAYGGHALRTLLAARGVPRGVAILGR
ncbi:hypothetical protein GETHPA_15360 [Geothrix rubra]|uniref:Uncharacterized protein n=1 Tax=Geothrix rubra TaxID=2927977 RepID=A0ABQ5Q694_9BACT|nr:hypothetical protein [Geothrix rubra]GLH70003.1 hypothetical protein GETHPA_15360 [Geothrix rubra]